ncbi:hypothetical protein CORC01_02928 [Colletotrichum orchidophilum]|uniref:Uncharacterized protein n=1 Tax=Colletotrichum orchidophilum TaxID=1209926 RepID=A0A1G4BKA6_9PEZI|nr:uncharacterized protein CORC01_02928 [Colletotrichum orchidophilum]OHF01737.1 hypothetical protein CORC01_02928 [Colletotrichum orchidophilum]
MSWWFKSRDDNGPVAEQVVSQLVSQTSWHSTKSNQSTATDCSSNTTVSYASALSDDSYKKSFIKSGNDDSFMEMMEHVTIIESGRDFLHERKIQSHNVKKRDINDTALRSADWTPQMVRDYASYKAKVSVLGKTRKTAVASGQAIKSVLGKSFEIQEPVYLKALNDDELWVNAALEAAKARLGFVTKYPDALPTKSTVNHIAQAADNLTSAKNAHSAIQTKRQKLRAAVELDERRARAAAGSS